MTDTSNQEVVEQHLIESARKILNIHYTHYHRIDQKSQWFLTLIGAVEGYFIINFFLNRKFNSTDIVGISMLVALLIGAIIISLYISILQSRPFYNGPDIEAQANDFRPNGSPEELRKDTLATLKISYQENVKIINKKAQLFKISIRGICLYFITLASYFALLKSNENDIPSDILLGGTSYQMTTSDQLPPEPLAETLLTTDNVGVVEAPELAEENADDTDELQSDNIDVSEIGNASTE